MKRKKILADYTREWLNNKGFQSDATYFSSVLVTQADHNIWTEGEITIRDCHNSITIEATFHNKKQLDNSVAKIDKLIEALKQTKASIKDGHLKYIKAKKKKR